MLPGRPVSLVPVINDAVRRVPPVLLYVAAPLPAIWWFHLGMSGGLGAEPIRALEHRLGEFALQLLIAGLAVTPLRIFAGLSLIKFRRAIGLIAFFYVLLHLLAWLVLDMNLLWGQIAADIAKRPYITIGMVAFVLLIPLALTSSDRVIRRIGPHNWRRIHRLIYAIVLLAGLHFVMVGKVWKLEPMLYLAAIVVLLALRMVPRRRRVAA